MIRRDYTVYISGVENNIVDNPRNFWSYVSENRKGVNVPRSVTHENVEHNDNQSIADAFGRFFADVFEDPLKPVIRKTDVENMRDSTYVHLDSISSDEIINKINALKTNKGPGPDLIPPIFIRSCAVSLSSPLHIIFNQSLRTGVFPREWKLAKITPIHKSGKTNLVSNYRPISVLSHFGKLFESIVTNFLFCSLQSTISIRQHGFFGGRSVLTNLSPYISYLSQNMDQGTQVDAVYTDLSKAFDKVHHATLLKVLSDYGVGSNLLRWIGSYLWERSQFVIINDAFSSLYRVESGVPQGSHLGPLLFILYINDICKCFHNINFDLYADDIKMYFAVKDSDDARKFQDDLNRFDEFCSLHYLSLNVNKCKHITFTKNVNIVSTSLSLSNKILEKVKVVKDLGIYLDSKLSFERHIDDIVSRSFRMLGFILRISRSFRSEETLKVLYFSLVRSIVEYATPIWNPFYHKYINRIERVQRKFTRVLYYRFGNRQVECPYDARLRLYRLTTLEQRRVVFDQIFLYRIMNGHFDFPLINEVYLNTRAFTGRRRELFYVPRARTSLFYNSIFLRIMRFYNWHSFFIDIFNISQVAFREELYLYLCRNY